MATFVLVHGAFIGGWAFRHVLERLRNMGHEAHAPTLTGIGERAHLLNHEVGLETHIQDILNLIVYEDLKEVILVGQSYGGMVITGVADRISDRIAKLVYLDAHVGTNGQNAMGALPDNTTEKLEDMSVAEGPRMLPPITLDAMGIFDAEARAWVEPKLCPHPMKCLEDVIHLENGPPKIPRHYVCCTDRASLIALFDGDPLAGFVEKAKREAFQFHEIASGHTPMVSHPQEVFETLHSIAAPHSG